MLKKNYFQSWENGEIRGETVISQGAIGKRWGETGVEVGAERGGKGSKPGGIGTGNDNSLHWLHVPHRLDPSLRHADGRRM